MDGAAVPVQPYAPLPATPRPQRSCTPNCLCEKLDNDDVDDDDNDNGDKKEVEENDGATKTMATTKMNIYI